jgi:hypothetical protein
VCCLCPGLRLGQFGRVIGLQHQVVNAGPHAARGDREVDARIVQHPPGIVAFDARGRQGEQLRAEADAGGQILNVKVDVETLLVKLGVNRPCGD